MREVRMCQGRAHLGHTGYLIRRVALFFVSAPGSGHVPTMWSLSLTCCGVAVAHSAR